MKNLTNSENSPFREDSLKGRLMLLVPDGKTQFRFTIWFDYTREMLNSIQDGDFIAVPNFAMEDEGIKYSILKLTSVLPQHFALGSSESDLKGYPGFVTESAKNLVTSWRDQETESLEDLTKISCIAVPTGLEFTDVDNVANVEIKSESAMPMIGEECKLISDKMTKKIINGGIDPELEPTIIPGQIIRNENIDVFLRIEDLVKTHFGLFGFTGVGKSNLLSSLISEILENNSLTKKVVLFDLMDEFTGLLIDKLMDENINGTIVYLGEKILPLPTLDYIYGKSTDLERAAEVFVEGMLLPKGLKSNLDEYKLVVMNLLKNKQLKIIGAAGSTLGQFYTQIEPEIKKNLYGNNLILYQIIIGEAIEPYRDEELNRSLADKIIGILKSDKIVEYVEKGTKTLKDKLDLLELLLAQVKENEDSGIDKAALTNITNIVADSVTMKKIHYI